MGPHPSITPSFPSPGFSVHGHLSECISKPKPSLGKWKFGSPGLSRGCSRSRGAGSLSLAWGLLPHQTGAPTGAQAPPLQPCPSCLCSRPAGPVEAHGMDRSYEQVFRLTLGPGGQCREPPPEQVGEETKCTGAGEAAAESPGAWSACETGPHLWPQQRL